MLRKSYGKRLLFCKSGKCLENPEACIGHESVAGGWVILFSGPEKSKIGLRNKIIIFK